MKEYKIVNNDYGANYILEFEDESFAMVNTELGEVFYDEPASLMTMGFWADDHMEPVTEEVKEQIDRILGENA